MTGSPKKSGIQTSIDAVDTDPKDSNLTSLLRPGWPVLGLALAANKSKLTWKFHAVPKLGDKAGLTHLHWAGRTHHASFHGVSSRSVVGHWSDEEPMDPG